MVWRSDESDSFAMVLYCSIVRDKASSSVVRPSAILVRADIRRVFIPSLIACLRSFKEEDFKASELRQYAQQFSVDRFKEKISLAVTREYERFKNGHEYLD
jgi:hypothetical protein